MFVQEATASANDPVCSVALHRLADAAPLAAAPFEVALRVTEDQGVARNAEPLASGIPLSRGAVMDPGDLPVCDAHGAPVACQAHQPGSSWPDGSLRWVLLQFPATVAAGETATYTLRADSAAPAVRPAQAVTVRDGGEGVEFTTGPLRLTVSRRDFRLPNRLEAYRGGGDFAPVITTTDLRLRADREHMTLEEFQQTGRDPKELDSFGLANTSPVPWGKVQRDLDYSSLLTGPARITVEENGPLRAVLRVERDAAKQEGDVGFVTRLYTYAGKPYIRVEYTL